MSITYIDYMEHTVLMVQKILKYAMRRVSVHQSTTLNYVVSIMLFIAYRQKTTGVSVRSYSHMLPSY